MKWQNPRDEPCEVELAIWRPTREEPSEQCTLLTNDFEDNTICKNLKGVLEINPNSLWRTQQAKLTSKDLWRAQHITWNQTDWNETLQTALSKIQFYETHNVSLGSVHYFRICPNLSNLTRIERPSFLGSSYEMYSNHEYQLTHVCYKIYSLQIKSYLTLYHVYTTVLYN